MADEVTARVPPELDGERVDKALATMLGVSRGVAKGLIEAGVRVSGQIVKASDRVLGGAEVVSPPPPEPLELEPEAIELEVLFEDDEMIVVNKPPGMVTHPGAGSRRGTLTAGLLHRYPELKGVGDPGRWGLVHRLDKDTSGTLIVGRTSGSYQALKEMIRRREVTRIYTALVDGLFNTPTGTIDSPIGPDPARPMRRAVVQGGKPAITHYEVIEELAAWDCSLLEVRLETGRTHQIRVHLAAIGHAVIGDKNYGGKVTKASSPRLFLHAARVEFRHPRSGIEIAVDAGLPPDLRSVLEELSPS